MTNTADDTKSSWWFKQLVPLLAILTLNTLFWLAGITPFGNSFFSARTVIYFLCWFALERMYAAVIPALMALGKKVWRTNISGHDTLRVAGVPRFTKTHHLPTDD